MRNTKAVVNPRGLWRPDQLSIRVDLIRRRFWVFDRLRRLDAACEAIRLTL
jgi:hypothetical protein